MKRAHVVNLNWIELNNMASKSSLNASCTRIWMITTYDVIFF